MIEVRTISCLVFLADLNGLCAFCGSGIYFQMLVLLFVTSSLISPFLQRALYERGPLETAFDFCFFVLRVRINNRPYFSCAWCTVATHFLPVIHDSWISCLFSEIHTPHQSLLKIRLSIHRMLSSRLPVLTRDLRLSLDGGVVRGISLFDHDVPRLASSDSDAAYTTQCTLHEGSFYSSPVQSSDLLLALLFKFSFRHARHEITAMLKLLLV